jgi:hypothetical protein
MENTPTFSEYVSLIYNRFEAFIQASASAKKMGHPYVYKQQNMIVFFMWMQVRRILKFKAQGRWLKAHPEALPMLSWENVPHRTTLSRRYKALYPLLQEFILFIGQDSAVLGEDLQTQHLYEDKSLFKAQGAVWHQSDREAGRIPDKLRQLDTDATWSKSAYHGWVYGYGLHLTCNQAGFPILIEVETATFSEKEAVARKEALILSQLQPETLCGDDAYTLCKRIRTWASHGIILLAPARRWRNGRYAQAYRRFLKQPDMAHRLRSRKTAIEPVFDLIAKLLGVTGKQKQLAIVRLSNVKTCIALAVLSLQFAMLANSIWQLPFRSISSIQGAFA